MVYLGKDKTGSVGASGLEIGHAAHEMVNEYAVLSPLEPYQPAAIVARFADGRHALAVRRAGELDFLRSHSSPLVQYVYVAHGVGARLGVRPHVVSPNGVALGHQLVGRLLVGLIVQEVQVDAGPLE